MRNRHGSKKVIENEHSKEIWKQVAQKTAEVTPDEVFHHHFDGGHSTEVKSELKIRAQQIAIGLPMDELMFSKFLVNLLGLSIMPWDALITTASTYLPDARNQIHNIFLTKTEATHLLMLDSDVLPPPDFINRMMAHNKPVVGGWYRKKERYGFKDTDGVVHVTQRPVVYDWNGEGFVQRIHPGTGLEKVDGAGAGCWMLRRDVAEALGTSPYNMASFGEDLDLCKKISNLGVDMFIDWDCACAHCGVFHV